MGVAIIFIVAATASAQEPVSFADANLKAAVEQALVKTDPTPSDMLALSTLIADSRSITNLTGLEYATNLTWLVLQNNQISDISALSGLTNLSWLNLEDNQIIDVSLLSVLRNLTHLNLYYNQISDISALSGLTNLTHLALGSNQVSDISALSGLTNLGILWLNDNQVSDISGLSQLTNLTQLHLNDNQINNISPLSGLTNLTYLDLRRNQFDSYAYCVYIPIILDNNPGVYLRYDPNPYVCSLQVEIDIKPGSYPNTINLGSFGLVPVAILSSDYFDATTVDPDTVELAGSGVAVRGKGSKLMAHEEDVNGDGWLDMVVQVVTENLDPDSFQDGYAILTGNLLEEFGGTPIEGQDEITIMPAE